MKEIKKLNTEVLKPEYMSKFTGFKNHSSFWLPRIRLNEIFKHTLLVSF